MKKILFTICILIVMSGCTLYQENNDTYLTCVYHANMLLQPNNCKSITQEIIIKSQKICSEEVKNSNLIRIYSYNNNEFQIDCETNNFTEAIHRTSNDF